MTKIVRNKFKNFSVITIFFVISHSLLFSEITKQECKNWLLKTLQSQDDSIKIYILDNIKDTPLKEFYYEIRKLANISMNDNVKLKSLYVSYKVYKDTAALDQISKFLLQKPKIPENAPQVVKAKAYLKNQYRAEAAKMLGELGDEKTVDILSKIINSDDDGNVKDAAYFALALLSQRGRIKPLPEMREFFYSGLKDLNPKVRLQAVKYIGDLRYTDAAQPLSLRLKDTNKQVVIEAIYSLGKLRDLSVPVLQELIQFKNHPDETYRVALADALGNIAEAVISSTETSKINTLTKIRNVLNEFLNDPNGMVRVTAAKSLLSLGDRTGVEVLKKGLDSNDIDVIIYSVEALGKYGDKEDIKFLEKFIQHQDLKVKTAVYCNILKIYFKTGQ
ncbi:MAG: HEAT repeat domain-containing protein [Endomicrobia bacterium]|nr:HEAT repeat domain-containing protein [Endomicrobiia bacterium]MDW8056484.1 HEAT repeat domain-containing protein [Elusimicrobiota bacterium]